MIAELEEEFERHFQQHPEVADYFCDTAMQVLLTGAHTISPWFVMAVMRHQDQNRRKGEQRRLVNFSNSLLPYYARLAIHRHPELRGHLKVKTLGTRRKVEPQRIVIAPQPAAMASQMPGQP